MEWGGWCAEESGENQVLGILEIGYTWEMSE